MSDAYHLSPEWQTESVDLVPQLMTAFESLKSDADSLASVAVDSVQGVLSDAAATAGELSGVVVRSVAQGLTDGAATLRDLQTPLSNSMGYALEALRSEAASLGCGTGAVATDNGFPCPGYDFSVPGFNPYQPETWPSGPAAQGMVRQPGQATWQPPDTWQLPSWYDPQFPDVLIPDFVTIVPSPGPPTLPPAPGPPPSYPVPPGPAPPSPPRIPPQPPTPSPPPTRPPTIPPWVPGPGPGPVPPPPTLPPPPPQQPPPTLPPPPQLPLPEPIPPTCPPPPPTCPAAPPCPPTQVVCPQLPEPPQDKPIKPMPGRGLPEAPAESVYCAIDAYLEWVKTGEGPGLFDQSHPIRYALIGDAGEYQAYAARVAEWSASLNPATRIAGYAHGAWIGLVDTVDAWLVALVKGSGCSDPRHYALVLVEALTNVLSIGIGDALRSRQIPLRYKTNAICPVEFPSGSEAIGAYLRADIDEDTLRTWLAQQGKCWEPYERVVASGSTRLTVYELLSIWRRGQIDDERLDHELRRLGHVDADNAGWYRELSKWIPPITDLIRFMVRDTADTALVERFGLDDAFNRKWTGDVAKWGEWQGVSAETARHYWRAHWQIPSPTQLFQMFHRSRGRAEDDPLYTSRADVESALQQQDVLPFWQGRLLDTTYIIPTRVDARRAFTLGAISADELRSIHVRQGYSDIDADVLVRFAKLQRVQSIKSTPVAKSYRSGITSRAAFIDYLTKVGLDLDERNQVINEITDDIRRPWLIRCGKALARRYASGELSAEELRAKMLHLTLSPEYVEAVVQSAECERESRGKDATTTQLCAWYDMGVLSPDEYVTRLRAVGWSEDDAIRILRQCSGKVSEKRAREAEKIARREANAIAKERAAAEREQRRRERSAASASRAAKIATKARLRRIELMTRAAGDLSKSAGTTVDQAGTAVQEMFGELGQTHLLTADQRVQSIVLAVERFKPASLAEFRERVNELAEELDQFGSLV